MYDAILLAIDDSDCAAAALDDALDLAARYDATLHAVRVVEAYRLSTVEERKARKREAADRLAEVAERAAAVGVDCETDRRTGFADRELLAAIDDHDADLVVMGTHGRSGVQQFLLGSVAAQLTRRSPVPVFTTAVTSEEWSVDTVLLPTDGSDHAEQATSHAIDVASTYDARLRVVSAVEDHALGYDVRATEILEGVRRASESFVDDTVARAEAAGVEASGTVVDGRAHSAILDAVDEDGADLVVMGTHGRSGVSRLLLGSVAEKVVRAAPVPVMTVPDSSRP